MKPFTLHAALRYREQLETRAQQRLVEAEQIEARLILELRSAEKELNELYEGLHLSERQGVTVDRLILFNHRIDLVRDIVLAKRDDLEKQQQQVAQRRQLLIKASRERKVIEKLREHQNAAYAKYLEKQEAIMLDETAVLGHERKRRNES
ncbi:MAG: flagellar export protein FliJ [Desulfobulbus sp.]|jgi:flagellar FliJ protein